MHNASNTFAMDEALGCARVKVQFGDDEQKLEVINVLSKQRPCKISSFYLVFLF